MENFQNNKRIAKNTLFLYFRMILLMAINLYTSRVILERLGINDYGIYNIVGGVITTFTFISSAMTASTQRFLNFSIGKDDESYVRKVFNASLVIHFYLAIFVVVLTETVGLWFIYNRLVIPDARMEATLWTFHFSVAATVFLILTYPYNALIIAREKMNVFAYVSVVEGVFKLLVAFIIGWITYDRLVFYAFLLMTLQVLVSIIYRNYCTKYFSETKFKVSDIDRKLYKELLSFSGWNILGNIANVCLTQGTNILLNVFLGPAVNAAKGLSVQVQNAVNQFCTNFQTAQNPQIVKSYASHDLNYMHSLVFRSSRYSYFLSFVFTLPVLMKIDWFLSIWLDAVPEYTAVFIQYTMGFNLIQSLASPLLISSMATGNVKKLMTVIAVFFWLVIPLCYIALKCGYSPVSVFQIQLILFVIAHFLRVQIVGNQIGFLKKDYIKKVLLPVLYVSVFSLGTSVIISFFWQTRNVFQTLSYLLIVFIINIISIWYLGMTKNERKIVRRVVLTKICIHND